jgi:UDPglucose 6-dehydrogenase
VKVGIFGVGVVGGAIATAFQKRKIETALYDKYKKIDRGNIFSSDFIFVCLPTPTVAYEQDLTELYSGIRFLDQAKYKGVIVLKSTVLPGTCKRLSLKFPHLKIVHNPEFLTANNAMQDFMDQKNIMISGNKKDCESVVNLFSEFFKGLHRVEVDIASEYFITEWAKYIHNCVLPVKLSFLNEVYQAIESPKDFDRAVDIAFKQGNLGITKPTVPGPDGLLGWGGMCFPKDTKALYGWFKKMKMETKTLEGAMRTNFILRREEMLE